MNSHDERRSRPRRPFREVKGYAKQRGLSALLSGKLEITFVDYSRDGAAFECATALEPGADLSLEFRYGAYYVVDLIATVRHTKKVPEGRFVVGVRFDYEATAKMRSPDFQEVLTSIEQML